MWADLDIQDRAAPLDGLASVPTCCEIWITGGSFVNVEKIESGRRRMVNVTLKVLERLQWTSHFVRLNRSSVFLSVLMIRRKFISFAASHSRIASKDRIKIQLPGWRPAGNGLS